MMASLNVKNRGGGGGGKGCLNNVKKTDDLVLWVVPFLSNIFFYICFYLGFWGVEGALCKILELCIGGQNDDNGDLAI